jgi:hypothetical protein
VGTDRSSCRKETLIIPAGPPCDTIPSAPSRQPSHGPTKFTAMTSLSHRPSIFGLSVAIMSSSRAAVQEKKSEPRPWPVVG